MNKISPVDVFQTWVRMTRVKRIEGKIGIDGMGIGRNGKGRRERGRKDKRESRI